VSEGFLAATFAMICTTLACADGLTTIQRVLTGAAGVIFLIWTTLWCIGAVVELFG
jgi:hypothetical protein